MIIMFSRGHGLECNRHRPRPFNSCSCIAIMLRCPIYIAHADDPVAVRSLNDLQ